MTHKTKMSEMQRGVTAKFLRAMEAQLKTPLNVFKTVPINAK